MTTLDAFVDFRDAQHALNHSAISDDDALRFLKERSTEREVRNLAFTYFAPDEYPTHRQLQERFFREKSG